jgi:endonuclease YncB( thermonuclease family)
MGTMRRGAGLAIRTVFTLVVVIAGMAWPASACVTPAKPSGLPTATVERVSDGDTVRLRFPSGRCPGPALVEMCAAWAERHRRRLVLVFDGHAPEGRAACETVAARNADDWITDAAACLNHYWLVTSDRELRRRAGARALRVIGGGSFARELQRR